VHDTPKARRWVILVIGTYSQAATCVFILGMPMLVPALRADDHRSLLACSLLVSAPLLGMVLTLIAWGAVADRFGERVVIASGVGAAALLLCAAAWVRNVLEMGELLVLAGAAGASVNAASGRVVMGWFPVSERGLAMGARQTAQPLGIAIAALALPPIAQAYGVRAALLFPAGLCVVAVFGVLLLVADPPRRLRAPGAALDTSPYRGSWYLGRVHLSTAMLVMPQFAVATFTLVYLVSQRHWDASTAARMIFGFQMAGAASRIASGVWSDRVRSRSQVRR
jgi:sugar phosphate permease